MCGRYASTRSRSELLETFKIEEAYADEEKAPDYNVAPTKTSPAVLARPPRGAGDDAEPVRQLRNLKWGLVPSWAKDPKTGNRILCTSQIRLAGESRPVCSADADARRVGRRHAQRPHRGRCARLRALRVAR
ncbi:SOS response-associated peptidase family protein [Kribbella swartbergensis]